jgi:hypothetical protein
MRSRCWNAGFNTNYLGQLVSTGIYAVVLVVAGKEALKPESRVSIGDVVLALSTLRNFGGSINALCNRLRNVGVYLHFLFTGCSIFGSASAHW